MKRIWLYVIGGLGVIGLLLTPPVLAQEMILESSGETEVDRLQAQCDTIVGTLRRLHTNDALLRVNIGQSYNGMSARFMARLNSRLALNRIDSANFVEISGRFDQERSQFSNNYTEYEAALSGLIRTDCKSRPTEFYAALIRARDARQKLATSVQSMNDSLRDYRLVVEELHQELTNGPKDEDESASAY